MAEELTLQVLSHKGALTAARLFGSYLGQEARPFMGHTSFWKLVLRLSSCDEPALTVDSRRARPEEVNPTSKVDILPSVSVCSAVTEIGLKRIQQNDGWAESALRRFARAFLRLGNAHYRTPAMALFCKTRTTTRRFAACSVSCSLVSTWWLSPMAAGASILVSGTFPC
jgi:hypothetical protein